MSSHAADPRHRRAPLAFAALMVAALASACSGGAAVPSSPGTSAGQPSGRSTPAAADTPTSPPAPAGDSSTRPEGAWTFVTWTTRRSDLKVDQPLARVILGSLTPSCSSGPCDLTLEPAGLNGTYEDPNGPPASDYVSSTKPVALQLKGKSYVGRTPSRVLPCTPKVGVPSIPDGYSTQTTMTLNFTPPSGGKPAHLYGTVAFTNKGTRAGKPKGCTDYSETRAIAGSPKGSLDSATAPRGTYDASMSSRGSSPTSLAPVGTSFWLGTMPAVATSNLLTITGVTSKAAPLKLKESGYGGDAPTAPAECQGIDGTASKKGSDSVESFSDIHPVAVTEKAAPIFVGTWRLRSNANKVGLKAGCSLTRWEGRLVLIPHGEGL